MSEPRQARAEITRRRIIDSAIDLFAEVGYGETGLAEIVKRADVTKGAFYYHFASKEAVAVAIIEETQAKIVDAANQAAGGAEPGPESVITKTFGIARLAKSDRSIGIGKELARSLTQISDAGRTAFEVWTADFVGGVQKAAAQGELLDDVDPDEVGEAIWVSVLGTDLLSNALGDDQTTRLAEVWEVLLHGIVPAESLGYFQEFVRRASLRPTATDQEPSPTAQ